MPLGIPIRSLIRPPLFYIIHIIYQKRFGTHLNTTLEASGIFGHFRGFSGIFGRAFSERKTELESGFFRCLSGPPSRACSGLFPVFFLRLFGFSAIVGSFFLYFSMFSAIFNIIRICSGIFFWSTLRMLNCICIWPFRVPFGGSVSEHFGAVSFVVPAFFRVFGCLFEPVLRSSLRTLNCSCAWPSQVAFGGSILGLFRAFLN